MDYSGNVVLSASDNEISVPEGASKIDIDKFGNIVATIDGEPEEIDTLGVVNIANTESMIKQGESYLTMADVSKPMKLSLMDRCSKIFRRLKCRYHIRNG